MSNLEQKVLSISWIGDSVEQYRLADHFEKAQDVAKALGLEHTYLFIRTYFDALKKDEVYHGFKHSIITFMNAVEGGLVLGLPDTELRCLATAALFHDLGHSCGGKTDRYNIQTAVAAFKQNRGVNTELMNFTDDEAKMVTDCIQATFFPWQPYADLCPAAKILRDADVMSAYIQCPKTILELYTGLMNEVALRKFPYGVGEFLVDQDKFRTSVVWNSRWGKLKSFKLNWPAQFQRVKQIMLAA